MVIKTKSEAGPWYRELKQEIEPRLDGVTFSLYKPANTNRCIGTLIQVEIDAETYAKDMTHFKLQGGTEQMILKGISNYFREHFGYIVPNFVVNKEDIL